MKQKIGPGAVIDFVTPDEMASFIARPRQETRIRQPAQVQLNAAGSGQDEVYNVPAGYEFELRRISILLGGPVDPVTGAVALNVAGKGVQLLHSGEFIEFAQPQYGAAVQIPGVQTWGAEQGPYFRSKETLEIAALGLTANGVLTVVAEGVLIRPSSRADD